MTQKDEEKEVEKEGIRTGRLDKKWCTGNQLGNVPDFIEYTDYSGPKPVKERVDFNIEIFASEKKTYLRTVASNNGTIDDIYQVQENFEDLLVKEALGLDMTDIIEFKKNKPAGVYETVSMKVQSALGMLSALTPKKKESLKNSEGQEK